MTAREREREMSCSRTFLYTVGCTTVRGVVREYVRFSAVEPRARSTLCICVPSPAPGDALSSCNQPESPKESKIRSIDHFYRSPANSWRLLCEYITTTCEYWLPRQSLSDPTGFPAPGDAQSRWNQPERPRRSILAA